MRVRGKNHRVLVGFLEHREEAEDLVIVFALYVLKEPEVFELEGFADWV